MFFCVYCLFMFFFFLMLRRPPTSKRTDPLFPDTTLFRSHTVFAGRRNGDKLAPLKAEIEAAGGRCETATLDARKEDDVTAFLQAADAAGPLDACIFNVGGNVNFPLLETTELVFRKEIGRAHV